MEPRFHFDFGRVRIHTDETAARSAAAVNAAAFTAGVHIVFSADRGEMADVGLLAHELAHITQAGAEPTPGEAWCIAPPGDPMEAAADAAARQALRGRTAYKSNAPVRPDYIYRQQPGASAGPATPSPTPRRIHLDTSVIDQLNRGNTRVAALLKKLTEEGAELSISVPTEVELTLRGADKQINAANQLMIEDLRLRRVPSGGTLTGRFQTPVPPPASPGLAGDFYSQYAVSGVRVQAKDISLLEAAARDGGAEVWTFDTNLLSQENAIEKHLHIKLAPESGQPRTTPRDYVRARKLMGLDPVTITKDGQVIRRPPVGGGGGRGGGSATGGPAGEDNGPRGAGGGSKSLGANAEAGSLEEPEEGRSPSRPSGSTGEAAQPGFTRTLGYAVLNFGVGLATGFLQQDIRQQITEDLGKLPKPHIDRRGASEFLRDPATGSGVRLLDLLDKDLKPFTADLPAHHQQIMAAAEFEILAAALLPDATSTDIERRFARLDAIDEELQAYDDQLSIVQQNLDAVLSQEPKAAETKKAVDQLIADLPTMFAIQAGAEAAGVPPPDAEDYTKMESGLRYISVSIGTTFTETRAAKEMVDRLIAEKTSLRDQIRKIWWNEFAIQLERLAKEQSRRPAPQALPTPTPASAVPAMEKRSAIGPLLTPDQQGTLAMLQTRVSEILFQLRQIEARLGPNPTDEQRKDVFQERQELLEKYRDAEVRLEAFKASMGMSVEN